MKRYARMFESADDTQEMINVLQNTENLYKTYDAKAKELAQKFGKDGAVKRLAQHMYKDYQDNKVNWKEVAEVFVSAIK